MKSRGARALGWSAVAVVVLVAASSWLSRSRLADPSRSREEERRALAPPLPSLDAAAPGDLGVQETSAEAAPPALTPEVSAALQQRFAR